MMLLLCVIYVYVLIIMAYMTLDFKLIPGGDGYYNYYTQGVKTIVSAYMDVASFLC